MHGSGLQNTITCLRGKLPSLNFSRIYTPRADEAHSAEELTILADSGGQRIPSGASSGTLLVVRELFVNTRFYGRDSLIRRINSLMTRFNSLLGQIKFPAPRRRELGRNY